jgi:3-hydroxyisobutyrate dehydrogenase
MKAGFIGIGNLGSAIVKRLIAEGVDLNVWNRTRSKAEELNVPIAEDPRALVSNVDVLFLNLFDSDAVNEVLTGEKGILLGTCKGKIIVDTTTNHFDRARQFHAIVDKAGAYYLEAPVLGSVVPASKGALTVLVSGAEEAYEKARPLIEKIGTTIFFVREETLSTKMKLINNMVLGSLMATLAEAIAFGEKVGLDRKTVINILAAGAGNSLVLNAKREKLSAEDFSTHFSSSLIYKDLHYLEDLARTLRRPVFTGSNAKELFAMTFSRQEDELDFSAIYNVFRDM